MKSISPDTFAIEALRDCIVIRDGVVRAMKRRVEAGDLQQIRARWQQRTDRRQVIGLMQRRQRDIALQARQHVVDRSSDGPIVVRAAVNDAMADGDRMTVWVSRNQARSPAMAAGTSANLLRRIGSVDQRRSVAPLRPQPRLRADAVDLTFEQPARIVACLESRRSGI